VVQIITNQGDDLQRYSTETVWKALQAEAMPHHTLVRVAAYILGEFGHTIADTPSSGAHEQLVELNKHFQTSESSTRALILNTYVKLAHTYGEIAPQVEEILQANSTAMDQEMQQRSIEYLALSTSSLAEVKNSVLEMMPHFTERESIVQKQLAKSQADNSTMPAASGATGARSASNSVEEAESPASSALSAAPSAPAPNLLGDDMPSQPTQIAPSSAADLLGGLSLDAPASGAVDAVAVPALAPAADDLLGLMDDAPAVPPVVVAPPADDLLDGLMGAPSITIPPSAAAGAPTPQYLVLCVRNDGVLHEDANVQVGVKMEFQGPRGRLALYIGNKSISPFMNVATQLSSVAGLQIQLSPLAGTIQPRAQSQQLFNIECTGPFGEAPQLQLRFASGAGVAEQQLVLTIPVPPTKFCQPLQIEGSDFFRRWNGLDPRSDPGREKQSVFKLPAPGPLAEATVGQLASGLGLAQLKGVDPNTTNFVLASWMATKESLSPSDVASILVRIEVNVQASMARLSVRSMSAAVNESLGKLLQSQLEAK
jgi:AP-2 complex subunit alpha